MKQTLPESERYKIIVYCRVITYAVLLVGVFYYFPAIRSGLGKIVDALQPFIIGFCLAFLLMPVVRGVEKGLAKTVFRKKAHPKISRLIGCALAVLLLVAIVVGFCSILLPQLISSAQSIVTATSSFIELHESEINDLLVKLQFLSFDGEKLSVAWEQLVSRYLNFTPDIINNVIQITGSVTGTLLDLLMGLIASIYLLADKERCVGRVKKVLYGIAPTKTANSLVFWTRRANHLFSGFISGKIVDSLIIGVLCYFGLLVLRIEYPPLISVVVGVTNVIPFFGPYIGAVPSILILLIVNPLSALKFAVFILVLQQLDGNLIGPLILGDHVGVSPFGIMFSIVVGGALFGFTGMLVSVPTYALVFAVVKTVIDRRLEKKHLPTETEHYMQPNEKEG